MRWRPCSKKRGRGGMRCLPNPESILAKTLSFMPCRPICPTRALPGSSGSRVILKIRREVSLTLRGCWF